MRHALALRHFPNPRRSRVIGGAVIEDGGAAQHHAAEDKQRPHHPTHVGDPHDPLSRPDVHPQGPVLGTLDRQPGVAVHGALGPSGGARGVQQHQGLIRRHRLRGHAVAVGSHDLVPRNLPIILTRRVDPRAVDDHQPLQLRQAVGRLGGDGQHRDRAPPANGGVGGDQDLGVGIGESLTDRLGPKAGEEWDGDGAQLGAGQQGDRILDDQRQIEANGDASGDANRVKSGGGPLHGILELRIGQPSGCSALGLADQRKTVGICAPIPDDGRVVGVEPGPWEPLREWNPGRGVHHLAVWRRPDDPELLDQGVPEPAGLSSRLLTQIGIAGAAVAVHEAPEPAAARLFVRG